MYLWQPLKESKQRIYIPEKWHHCISYGSEGTGPNGSGAKEGVEVLLPDLVRVGLGLAEVVREAYVEN
jgi:hypothetical protein